MKLIVRSKDLLRTPGQRISNQSVVLSGTKDKSNGWILPWTLLLRIKVPGVEQHLSDVLLGELTYLQIDEQEGAKQPMVEDEINVKVIAVNGDSLLPGNEEQISAKLKQKMLQASDERLFKITLLPLLLPEVR